MLSSLPLCALYAHPTLADVQLLCTCTSPADVDAHVDDDAAMLTTASRVRPSMLRHDDTAFSCMVSYAEYSDLHTRCSLHTCATCDVDWQWRRLCRLVATHAAAHCARDDCARDRRLGAHTLHMSGAFVWRTCAATMRGAAIYTRHDDDDNTTKARSRGVDDKAAVYVFGLVTQCATRAERKALCRRACAVLTHCRLHTADAALPLAQALRAVHLSLAWAPSRCRVTPHTPLPCVTAIMTRDVHAPSHDDSITAVLSSSPAAATAVAWLRAYANVRLFLCAPVTTTLEGVCMRALHTRTLPPPPPQQQQAHDNAHDKHSHNASNVVCVNFVNVAVRATGEYHIAAEAVVAPHYRHFVPALYSSLKPFLVVDRPDA